MKLVEEINDELEELQYNHRYRSICFNNALLEILVENNIISTKQANKLDLINNPIHTISVPDNKSPFDADDMKKILSAIYDITK